MESSNSGEEKKILSEDNLTVVTSSEGKIPVSEKQGFTGIKIPLSALIAVVLAILLMGGVVAGAVASAAYRYGYNQAVSSIFGDGVGNDEETDSTESSFKGLEFLDQFFKAYSYLDLSEVDFLTAVLKAYTEATGDLYAEYYTEEEFDAMLADNAGEGVGVGISVIYSPTEINGVSYMVLEIITVMPNSPAEKAGVLPGDRVMYVGVGEDRILVQESGYTEAVNSLRGEKGTEAKFTVFRPQKDGSFEEIPFQIVRDKYEVQSVEYKISETDSTVGIVRILQFAQKTPQQFSEAMDDLIARGITKFVFDVRNNPGGDLKSINAILSYFLNEGDKILSTEDRAGKTEEYRVGAVSYTGDYEPCSVSKTDIGKYRGCQATVLTNGNTASAAELFTATMRDYTLATIVGETTYGKGSMQSIYPLYYWGYEGAVKLTTKHYFPPCGEGYDGVGITPDVVVSLSEEAANINIYKLAEADDDQLQAALALLKAS